ncbi:transcriptional coactivator/pterin dehydratase [Zopfia rhizophila CBS 207.26]|uniref:4a-hydroxytetrahydrobiopterin dehydratase n=1 Tax=Zopfia rhizophila CBS 207.26 TaxID=1314779 RepID=A0A6A6EGZ2_9PEZI|nr:transcriptional coactivator/pterin dehydratase [Zopfia rhizophila CBS 207.26]
MYENRCRAGIPPIVHRSLQIPARRPIALPARSSRSGSFRLSSSHATSKPDAKGTPSSETSSIIFSENQPTELPNRVSKLTAWTITPSNMGITRRFTFPTFSAAWRFMSSVAEECKAKRHHPIWSNLYNEVTIEWTTHQPKGLSIKDVEMAEFCDRTADAVGLKKEQIQSTGTANSSEGSHNSSNISGRGDHIVIQKRAMHIPSEAIALKLRRRFGHRR